jgi:hypothetical protein
VASTIGRVQDLVVENGEVESQSKTDWMSRSELGLSYICSILGKVKLGLAHMTLIVFTYLVSLMSGSSGNLALLARCKLRKVTMVVALPVTHSILGYDPPTFRNYPFVMPIINDLHLMVENLRLA